TRESPAEHPNRTAPTDERWAAPSRTGRKAHKGGRMIITDTLSTINDSYYFIINGRIKRCPAHIWDAMLGARDIPHDFACNGCTASPDTWRGYLVWPACRVRDYDYRPGSGVHKTVADLRLRANLWRCLGAQKAPLHLRAAIST